MIYNLAKITDVATIVSGNTPSGIDDLYEDNGEIPFFRVSDMNSLGNEIWMTSSINNLSFENARKLKLKICDAGTVIFPKRGGAIFTNKKRILSKPSTYDLNTMGLVPNEKVENKYFFYWFNSLDLSSLADGSSVPQLNNKQILPLQIPLPSLLQQQKIASILDAADELRQNDKALIAKYDQLTQALFLDMFGDPVSNSKGWEKVSGKKVFKLVGGAAFKSTDYTMIGLPLIRIGTVNKGYFDSAQLTFLPKSFEESHSKYIVYPNDLLITLTGTVGKDDYGNAFALTYEYEKYLLNQRVAKICSSDNYNLVFLKFFLKQKKVKNELIGVSRGVRQANLSNEDFYKLEVISPTLNIQNQFADRVALIEEQKSIAQASLLKSEELFNSLLQKAFKGELT